MALIPFDSITSEQWAQIEELRRRWLDEEQTAQYSVDAIRQTVRKAFRICNIKCPKMIWVVDSPVAAQLIIRSRENHDMNFENLDADLRKCFENNLRANITQEWDFRNSRRPADDLRDYFRGCYRKFSSSAFGNVEGEVPEKLRVNFSASLKENIFNNLRTMVGTNIQSNFRVRVRVDHGGACEFDTEAALIQATKMLNFRTTEEQDFFVQFVRHCHVLLWSKTFLFVLRRPKSCHWTDTSVDGWKTGAIGLHNENGPAAYYSKVFQIWSINGVNVDEQIVMRPQTQTIEQLRNENNEEIKRIRIERFGWDNYLSSINAETVDQRRNDVDGTHEALFAFDTGKAFCGRCVSTGRVYFLEVPPELETCEQAQQYFLGGRFGNCLGAS